MTTHLVLPDCQIRPGDDLGFLTKIGTYIVDKQPDVVINIGDFADMPSLSSYDVGRKSFEGRRYVNDVEAVRKAMEVLLKPLNDYNTRQRKNGKKQYLPRLVLTLGNHEERILRAVNSDSKLEGVLKIEDLGYREAGWEVHKFLDVVIIDGIAYSHYFVTGVAGRPASSAAAQLRRCAMSCVAGHQQGLQIHTGPRADGVMLHSIIAGSCYEHNEDYLGPQGNKHWRGLVVLNGVKNGEIDGVMPVSLNYLNKRYAD